MWFMRWRKTAQGRCSQQIKTHQRRRVILLKNSTSRWAEKVFSRKIKNWEYERHSKLPRNNKLLFQMTRHFGFLPREKFCRHGIIYNNFTNMARRCFLYCCLRSIYYTVTRYITPFSPSDRTSKNLVLTALTSIEEPWRWQQQINLKFAVKYICSTSNCN